jgi:hypothetical protein
MSSKANESKLDVRQIYSVNQNSKQTVGYERIFVLFWFSGAAVLGERLH